MIDSSIMSVSLFKFVVVVKVLTSLILFDDVAEIDVDDDDL